MFYFQDYLFLYSGLYLFILFIYFVFFLFHLCHSDANHPFQEDDTIFYIIFLDFNYGQAFQSVSNDVFSPNAEAVQLS